MRRRRHDADIILIRATKLIKVDEFSDAVFKLCDGTADVLTVIKTMVSQYHGHDPVAVAAHTIYNLEYFQEHGLIREE